MTLTYSTRSRLPLTNIIVNLPINVWFQLLQIKNIYTIYPTNSFIVQFITSRCLIGEIIN